MMTCRSAGRGDLGTAPDLPGGLRRRQRPRGGRDSARHAAGGVGRDLGAGDGPGHQRCSARPAVASSPTDAGETFAAYVRKLLGLLAEAAGAVHDADRGRLRIGAVATASEYVLPRLMASFADEHPQVELSLSVLPRDELFALAARPRRRCRAGRTSTARVRAGHRAPAGPTSWCSSAGPAATTTRSPRTWLLTGQGSGTRDTTLSLLTRLQAAPPLLTLGTSGAAVAAARQGLGVTWSTRRPCAVNSTPASSRGTPYPGLRSIVRGTCARPRIRPRRAGCSCGTSAIRTGWVRRRFTPGLAHRGEYGAGRRARMLLCMTTTLRTDLPTLADTARRMTHAGRGILAADESIKTMSSRLGTGRHRRRARPHVGTTASC